MKRLIWILILCLSLSLPSIALYADCSGKAGVTLKQVREKNVVVREIGNNEIIVVIMIREEASSHWFLLSEEGNRKLGNDLCAFHQLDSLSASPAGEYLAVMSVGEGHPMVEVVDLKLLRQKGKYNVLHEINPYPGTISIEEWRGNQLILSSDVPLDQLKKNKSINVDALSPKAKRFLLDIKTGKITKLKE